MKTMYKTINEKFDELIHGFIVDNKIAKKYPILKVGEAIINVKKTKAFYTKEIQDLLKEIVNNIKASYPKAVSDKEHKHNIKVVTETVKEIKENIIEIIKSKGIKI